MKNPTKMASLCSVVDFINAIQIFLNCIQSFEQWFTGCLMIFSIIEILYDCMPGFRAQQTTVSFHALHTKFQIKVERMSYNCSIF